MPGTELGQLIVTILVGVGTALGGVYAGWKLRKKAEKRREIQSDYFDSRDSMYEYAERKGEERDQRAEDRE